MNSSQKRPLGRGPGAALRGILLFAVAGAVSVQAAVGSGGAGGSVPSGLIVLLLLTLGLSGAALFFSLRARAMAITAAQEAGAARARAAQAPGGNLTSDALAATERVWATRLQALEAQIQGTMRPGKLPVADKNAAPTADLLARVEEMEKAVAGLSMAAAQAKRTPLPPAPVAAPSASTIPWPTVLLADRPGMGELRQVIQQAIKAGDTSTDDLFTRLRAVEQWPTRKPGSPEVVTFLQETSQLLFTVLRKGASVAPLDASMLADRLLGALRPAWQALHPTVDCRFFYPGVTFDPDWMEDLNPAGLRRPTISEMLSWAVFEKQTNGRKVLAKARVTTE